MEHFYKVLELKPGADKGRIRKAYRRLARKYHPDVNPSPEAQHRFLEIQQAYEALMNYEEDPFREFKEQLKKEELRQQAQRRQAYEERQEQLREIHRRKMAKQAVKDRLMRKQMKITTVVGLCLSLLFLVDHLMRKPVMGRLFYQDQQTHFEVLDISDAKTIYQFTNNATFDRWLKPPQLVGLSVTPICNVVTEVRFKARNQRMVVEPFNVYNLKFMLYLMALFAIPMLFFDHKLNTIVFLLMGLLEIMGITSTLLFYWAHSV